MSKAAGNMGRVLVWWALCAAPWLVAAQDASSGAGTPASTPPPREFPSVALVAGSQPRYAAFQLDPWKRQTLYMLFDGNSEVGYNRLYVWSPGRGQYTRPAALSVGSDGRFPPIAWRETEGNEVAEVNYVFGSRRSTGITGTTGPRQDYQTGAIIAAGPRRAYTNISLTFSLDYVRDRSPQGGPNRLMLRIPGPINVATNFAEIRALSPWEAVYFRWSVARQAAGDADAARLAISGNMYYHHEQNLVTIQAIPAGFFDMNITVSPYLKEPVFSQTVPMIDLVRDGLTLELSPTWYTAQWQSTVHAWLGGRNLSGQTGLMALGRDRPQTTVGAAGASPAPTVLRGPPPPLLRGPGN